MFVFTLSSWIDGNANARLKHNSISAKSTLVQKCGGEKRALEPVSDHIEPHSVHEALLKSVDYFDFWSFWINVQFEIQISFSDFWTMIFFLFLTYFAPKCYIELEPWANEFLWEWLVSVNIGYSLLVVLLDYFLYDFSVENILKLMEIGCVFVCMFEFNKF